MAQLDRLLSVMVSNRANALVLNEGDVAQLEVPGGVRPVTKQPLTSQQVVALLREIAPADAGAKLEAGAPATFQYSSDDGIFIARAALADGRWEASICVDDDGAFLEQTGGMGGATAVATPVAAPAVRAAAPSPVARPVVTGAQPVVAEPAPNVFVADPRAKIEIDTLLKHMVSKGA